MYLIHGYEPGEIEPSTQLLLEHKHPEERPRANEVLDKALATGEPFSYYHRIIDTHQQVRHVVVLGEGHHDEQGQVQRVSGYIVDLTESPTWTSRPRWTTNWTPRSALEQ
ncbi:MULTISPECIES: PAS domain-containing protein [Pseudonocardiaceae]|uniref:PAS domain-containing protein n=1 Tax=Amycolatopsis roodepoortensis TaxID=700274 RepID=A0ABR9LGV4_9PSEU|nr:MULTISPECIES: PAS domain-containing protein [Pseudonocardiaceae]MBE1579550.1 hypothetical protein [Amycolatopsis roodepoortensis]OLZ51818.1 hypothetical protein BS330_24485 [Amycolatopsis keratiniphila subsp. nogabecina]